MELLAPAGNLECLLSAIYASCDAIYIGGKSFGARGYAKNFDEEDLKYARYLTRLYNVKLYVTVNTLVYDSEIDDLINYVRFLHKIGVDALIVQDIGVINILRNKFPNLEVHASTQMNIHNESGFELLKDLGLKRIVLAREVSLDKINNIKTDIEREIFVHGSLCVSYSGCCLLSSYIGGRSGNRGLCAGTCRLPFQLYNNKNEVNTKGKYLLSMKDLYTLDKLEDILKSNVHSLKIEGRMKSKEYVYSVVSIYRKYIDMYNKYGYINIDEKDIDTLKILFNREFTNGYLFNSNNVANIKTPNNIGLYVGEVVSSSNYKFNIKTNKDIYKEDGLRIIYKNKEYGLLVSKVEKKSGITTIYTNKKVDVSSKVYITSRKNIDIKDRKININMNIEVSRDKIIGKVYNDRCSIQMSNSEIVQIPIKNKTAEDIIKKQLSKTGNTVFNVDYINIKYLNDVFINIKDLNDFRKNLLNQFERELTKNNIEFIELDYKLSSEEIISKPLEYSAYVKEERQLIEVLKYPLKRIYVEQRLYYKYKDKYDNLVLVLPRINDLDYKLSGERLLIRELGSLKYSKNNYVVSDYTLNITNSYSYEFLKNNKVDKITLSTEITNDFINMNKKNDLEIIIYGKIELAILKYCLISNVFNKNKGCKLCYNSNYYLVDRKEFKYNLISDNNCNLVILSSGVNNKIYNLNNYIKQGISSFRFNFYDENVSEISKILGSVLECD